MKHTPEKELIVTVEYPAMNKTVNRLVSKIKSCNLSLCCLGEVESLLLLLMIFTT